MKITWVNFIHLYQPPFQDPILVKQINKESYLLIIKLLKENPNFKLTVNFSGSLTELLVKNKLTNTLKEFKRLAQKGQIEFVSTAKYHPILPLIPDREIEIQIKANDKINRSYFGSSYNPTGFYFPEMSYSTRAAKIVKKLGYDWTILDRINDPSNNRKDKVHVDKESGLKILFRHKTASKNFPLEVVYDKLTSKSKTAFVISATDGEIYGHHHKEINKNHLKVLKDDRLESLTVSQAIKKLPNNIEIKPRKASWETKLSEIKKNNPFPLWNNPKNNVHRKMWELANMVIKVNEKYNYKDKHIWARKHLNMGLASCSWWWAASRKPDIFSPITWNPDEIEKGINNLIRSIRSLDDLPNTKKIEAEKLYSNIVKLIWKKHWQKKLK